MGTRGSLGTRARVDLSGGRDEVEVATKAPAEVSTTKASTEVAADRVVEVVVGRMVSGTWGLRCVWDGTHMVAVCDYK